jgi:hypothetical protein
MNTSSLNAIRAFCFDDLQVGRANHPQYLDKSACLLPSIAYQCGLDLRVVDD